MTSLIKNQVLKHLTKFFKDLAPEQLQLSAFKGSSWIRINKAVCDQLSIRIPWTKIKSVPIQMNLNEVTVEVEVCEEFRDIQTASEDDASQFANLINNAQAPSKYGFVDRVIDGITVTVNNILIEFKSKLMSATFNLSRVSLESRCPNWKPGELSLTRIKDPKRGQILLFKIVEWQTMRLEAKCLTDPNQAPLRLITNHAQCRLTIKKNLDDCLVVAARIFVIFEDILWVLTFAQFTSATSFVEYIFKLIKRSPMSNKTTLLDNQSSSSTSSSSGSLGQSANGPPLISPLSTPIHCTSMPERPSMLTDKVDAHLYDDIETSTSSGASRNSGGALQTTLDHIQVDCYPYSRVVSDRKHWYNWFDPSPGSRRRWIKCHFTEFDSMKMRRKSQLDQDSALNPDHKPNEQDKPSYQASQKYSNTKRTVPIALDDQLLSLVVLVKIKDYCMHCVATSQSIRSAGQGKFIETDKDYHMPTEMPALYLELNYFYYFDAINRMMVYEDVPAPLSFIHLSPTKLLFDSPTLVFLNSFRINLSKAFVHLNDIFPEETAAPKLHCRIEILMPQIILPAKAHGDQQPNGATSSLHVKSGKVTLSSSINDREVLTKLLDTIDKLRESPSQPINFGGYQSGSAKRDEACTNDWTRVWNTSLVDGSRDDDNGQHQVFVIQYEPVWMDFMNYDVDDLSSGQRLEPIVEPVNAYAFIHLDLSPDSAKDKSLDVSKPMSQSMKKRSIISILVSVIDGPILANMDKVQFGFLQRLGMHVEKMLQRIKEDASSIIQLETIVEDTLEINLTAYVRDIKARLILDKKIGTQSYVDGVPGGPSHINTASKHKASLNVSLKPMNSVVDNSGLGSCKSPQTQSDLTELYSSVMSNISNTFSNNPMEEKLNNFSYLRAEESSAIIDESALGSRDQLDDCVEMADDAACLLLNDQTTTPIDVENHPKSINTNNLMQTKSTTSEIASVSGPRDTPARSIGKSPIEESLLIDLDEIEQASSLFAKVDLKSSSVPESEKQRSIIDEKNTEFTKAQEQDIESESISYLELSMSQLMVRRITETKRRQKF